ncbi:MAG: serine hydrolase [Adhaeribacter sp.]
MPGWDNIKNKNYFIYSGTKKHLGWFKTLISKVNKLKAAFLFFTLIFLVFVFILAGNNVQAQKRNLVEQILRQTSDSLLQEIVVHPDKYQVQILYTQINRDKNNFPKFTSYAYNLNAEKYFYPASTVKLPGALAALEKINNLNIPGLTKETPLTIDSAYQKQTRVRSDSTAANGKASVAHYIKKIFLVSDNDAYNRLYEFVGQETLNQTLHQKGYKEVRLLHRLSVGDDAAHGRYTNPVTFYHNNKIIYQQPLVFNPNIYPNKLKTTLVGKGFYQDGKLINSPIDFSERNNISIKTLHEILQAVIFPEAAPAKKRFNLTPDDYNFLYKYMAMRPRESSYPSYNPQEFNDSYGKFFMYGGTKEPMPPNIRIFNKAGWAYGYLIDNAYIVDLENNVEFLLTAVILANEDLIFNDDKYEYDTVGLPFMNKLGNLIYKHELIRKKKYEPDLQKFRITF